jgi:hypothetical protein
MKPRIYIETSVVSYLAARPSRDLVRRAQQMITVKWWQDRHESYGLFSSQFVVDEAAAGDPRAAIERAVFLDQVGLLDITPEVYRLGEQLIAAGALPPKARMDGLHLAVATVNGMDFLMTWNCRHLANAALRHKIETCCDEAGYRTPTICTPYGLSGDEV